jgi:genome maintenance exonuclease 1
MYEFLKQNHDMKKFDHVRLNKILPDISTENIKGKRFYVTPEGNKYPSITTVLSDRNKEGIVKWRESVGNDVALIENYLNNEELSKQDVLPVALFVTMKSELDNINNIRIQEGGLYSDKLGVAGRVDCIAEYKGKISVIDFKTSTKEKKEEWVENYFIQGSAYCEMYEERFLQPIEQVVILIVTEDGAVQTFIKDKRDYLPLLKTAIKEFNEKNN